MNESDRRVVRTRRAILDSFIKLTLELGFDAVTIREITKWAKVSYSTFFRHFKNKDELTNYVFNLARERIYALFDDRMNPIEEALAAFSYMSRERGIFLLCVAVPRDHPAVTSLRNELAATIKSELVAVDESAIPVDVIAYHTSAAILELCRWWLENDSKYTAEQMANIYYELVVKVKLANATYRERTS